MFLNFTNHRCDNWSKEQIDEARKYGEIVELEMPLIAPNASEDEVIALATDYSNKIFDMKPQVVLCQGEFTFTYEVIKRLKKHGIQTVAACSNRVTTERFVDGELIKESKFKFVKFRKYN